MNIGRPIGQSRNQHRRCRTIRIGKALPIAIPTQIICGIGVIIDRIGILHRESISIPTNIAIILVSICIISISIPIIPITITSIASIAIIPKPIPTISIPIYRRNRFIG